DSVAERGPHVRARRASETRILMKSEVRSQKSEWWRRTAFCILSSVFCLLLPPSALAQTPVVEVVVEQEGVPVTDPVIRGLLKTSAGAPLDMRDVRESISHFMSLNRYEDVQVFQEEAGS